LTYVTGVREPGHCFLCEKGGAASPEQDIANLVIARGRTAFVLLNAYPYNSGHAMIAPYRHAAGLVDLTVAERNELLELQVKLQKAMELAMRPAGFNFGFNLGEAAGAGLVGHLHGHLVPRWHGDTNFMPVLADVRIVSQALEDTARLLRQAWVEING
jgi:ATP adenylyltransferase